MALKADVVVENFRPGVVSRLGIDYAAITHVNPRIIYCSISAFGQSGPYKAKPGYDTIGQALSGLLSILTDLKDPNGPGAPFSDHLGAIYGCLMSTGEFPLMGIVYPDRIEQMKANGEPVDWVRTADPILVNLGLVVIAAKAPHPNAAKLFYNYSVSREGQTILRKRNRVSARDDVPPLVHDMDPKKLRLVPLDPEIATTTKYTRSSKRSLA